MIIKNENIKFKKVKLKDVLTIKNGKSQKEIEDEDGTYGIYGTGGLMGYTNSYLGQENSIIIGRKGTIDKPLFMNKKYWVIDTAFYTDNFLYDPKYLYYIIKKINFHNYSKSAVIPSLTKNDLNEINILVAEDLDYAKKIGCYLDNVFNRIEKIKKLIEKIEIRNQYYADKLTIGEISIDENGKVSNLKAELVNFKLFELFDFRMGQTILGKDVIKKDDSEKEVDTQIPVYSATENDVPFGFINISKVNKLLNENDIIISARGTIGFPKLNNIKQKTSTQTTIQMISKGLISSYMVKKCINVKKDYFFSSEGAAVPQLTINTLSNKIIEIVKDTSNVESFLKKLDNEKEKVEKLLKLEEQRFEWLSDKLLSGEYIIED